MIHASTMSADSGYNGAQSKDSEQVLGKSDFLNLLVTQLQYQDPLNPMESTEFTAQLAQFSSLEQLTNVNENLADIYSAQQSFNNSQAVSFIGKEVKALDSSVVIDGAGGGEMNFEMAEQTGRVFVDVYDASGATVRRFDLEGMPAGENSLSWDGRDDQGMQVPPGIYEYQVYGVGLDEQTVEAECYSLGTVTGVSFEGGEAVVKLGSKTIGLGEIIEVRDPV